MHRGVTSRAIKELNNWLISHPVTRNQEKPRATGIPVGNLVIENQTHSIIRQGTMQPSATHKEVLQATSLLAISDASNWQLALANPYRR